MKLKDKINKYSTHELRKLGLNTIKVAREVLGHGNKPSPSLKINNRLKNMYGLYDYNYCITINPSVCKNISVFIGVIIHEYTHHIQKGIKSGYDASIKKYGYYNCPFEVEARDNAKKYKKKVWKKVKQTLQNP
jgi:predicted SprT family Zn-dependent metalloprotease